MVDETGGVKKDTHTVGVQRQYTGSAGRIENAQVAVDLVYAGCRGHAAVDRDLYIPRSWTCDPDRCRAAGLGEDIVFATKPEPAFLVIGRFLDAGHRVGWVAGDEVYGGNPRLRAALEERGVGYVLAVACSKRDHQLRPRDADDRAVSLRLLAHAQGVGRAHRESSGWLSLALNLAGRPVQAPPTTPDSSSRPPHSRPSRPPPSTATSASSHHPGSPPQTRPESQDVSA